MTNRISTLTVVLSEDFRDDDATALADAISQFKGVFRVELGPVVDVHAHVARARIGRELSMAVLGVIEDKVRG